MEIRSFGENAAPKLLDERMIEGYAIVFERESRVMYDLEKKRFFIEVIKSGAISDELLRSCDIKALLEHNKQRLLARCNNGEGSLSLDIDEKRNIEYSQRDGLLIRTVNKIDKIFDISIVSDPAYFGTDVTVRSLGTHIHPVSKDNYQIKIEKLRTLI